MARLLFHILLIFSLQANASSYLTAKDTVPGLTRDDYRQMSKHQLTTAIVIVSVGGAAFIGGAVYVFAQLAADATVSVLFGTKESNPVPAGYYIMMIGGAILALCSIPVFASAKKNRRLAKTATVGINIENLNGTANIGMTKAYFPAINFRLRF